VSGSLIWLSSINLNIAGGAYIDNEIKFTGVMGTVIAAHLVDIDPRNEEWGV